MFAIAFKNNGKHFTVELFNKKKDAEEHFKIIEAEYGVNVLERLHIVEISWKEHNLNAIEKSFKRKDKQEVILDFLKTQLTDVQISRLAVILGD